MDVTLLKVIVFSSSIFQIGFAYNTKTTDVFHQRNEDKTILVFGGNGFIGAATVEELLRGNFSVVVINRGNWYWDTAETVKPYVQHLRCDRMQSLQRCSGLQHYLWSDDAPLKFEAVVDFSAYHAFEITEALNILNRQIKKYIYISSDSVYEVCNKTHDGYSVETDSVRPNSSSERIRFQKKDNYGHRKLECEEELEHQSSEKNGVPYISLRLPDVIGPRDNTYRWWIYQLWIKISEYLEKKLSVPKLYWNRKMSLVHVDDVAKIITKLIDSDLELYNNAYNLALIETPTLMQMLHGMMDALDVEDTDIKEDADDDGFRLFPSVKSGPLNTTKATRLLDWKPTPWLDVLERTVAFYETAMNSSKFDIARKDVIQTLQQHFSTDPVKVIRGVEAKYNIQFGNVRHDEL